MIYVHVLTFVSCLRHGHADAGVDTNSLEKKKESALLYINYIAHPNLTLAQQTRCSFEVIRSITVAGRLEKQSTFTYLATLVDYL